MTTIPDHTTTREFATVIASWPDELNCEAVTQRGQQCRRPATWRLNLHGCEQALMCGQHLQAWLGGASADHHGADPRCAHCGFVFNNASDAYSVTPL